MPSAFDRFTADDASKFVDPTLFGVAATYTAAGQTVPSASSTINVSFSEPTDDAALDQPAAQDSVPTAVARTEDVPDARAGDTLVIGATTYFITSATLDGFGHTILTLSVETGFPRALAPYDLDSSYPGTGLTVVLTWLLPTDARRTAVQVWRTALLPTPGDPVLVTTLAAGAVGYTDAAPAPGVFNYEIVALSASGPSAGASLGIEVNPAP